MIKVCVSFVFIFLFCCPQNLVSAFSSGLHLRSASDLVENCRTQNQKPFVDLKEDEIDYIKSGAVIADVGRFSLDKRKFNSYETNLFPASDEMEFIDKVKENARTREEKFFVFGMELHYWQDKYLPKFSKTVFGSKHKTTYLDYAKYDKWCLFDCKSKKISTVSLNNKNYNFNFEPIYNVIKNIYNRLLCWTAYIVKSLLSKNYYSDNGFFELRNCTDLLVRTYNKLLPENKKINSSISSKFINDSIDTVVGAHAVLSSIPFIGLSDYEKINAGKAYNDMQDNLMGKIKNYDWSFLT